MKALELTVYPRADEHTDHQGRAWFWACQACSGLPDEYVGMDKRLTDAELAAELFRQAAWLGAIGRTYATGEGRNILIEAAFTFGPMTRDEHEYLTVSNFLALPHYDEASA